MTRATATASHPLKTWPLFFEALLEGSKTFEVRRNDRGFEVGDNLRLLEWLPTTEEYTGRTLDREVTYILEGEAWGVAKGFVVMGLGPSSTREEG